MCDTQAIKEVLAGDLQAVIEVPETGPQPANKMPQAKPKATSEQGAGYVVPDPGDSVLSLLGKSKDWDLAWIRHDEAEVEVIYRRAPLGQSGQSSRGPTLASPPAPSRRRSSDQALRDVLGDWDYGSREHRCRVGNQGDWKWGVGHLGE